MQFFPVSYLMTMNTLPQLDRKIVAYGVFWVLAIAAALTALLA